MSSERNPVSIVRAFHQGADVEDSMLCGALGISRSPENRSASLPALLRRFGNQNFGFGTLSFRELREVFRTIRPRRSDVFCDAGAGYGHAVFYGASIVDCRFRAVEIMPARCNAMRKTARRLGLCDVEIVQGDALAQDYADVSYLFVNNPFFPAAAMRFIARVKTSRRRALTVIAVHNVVEAFRADRDFSEIEVGADLPDYCFGVFRWSPRRRARAARKTRPAGSAPSRPG